MWCLVDLVTAMRRLGGRITITALIPLLAWSLATEVIQYALNNKGNIGLVKAVNQSDHQGLLEAFAIFQRLTLMAEEDPVALRSQGYICMLLQDWGCARSALEMGERLAPNDVMISFRLGNLYASDEEWDSAIVAWKQAGAAPYLFYHGQDALVQGEVQQAIQYLRLASLIEPEVSDAFYLLGVIHERQGSWQEARENYAQAVGNNLFIWHEIADTVMLARAYAGFGFAEYQITRNLEYAIMLLTTSADANPDDGWTLIRLCDVNRLAGDWMQALIACDRAVQVMPNQHWSFFSRARVFMLAQKYEQAKQDLEIVLSIDPTFSPAQDALSEVLERLSGK
jgi:tetratricopeptide (TPR) repeat protein